MSCDHTFAEARSASAPPGSVDSKDEFGNEPRMLQGERLDNETPHRPSEHVCPLDTEHLDYSRGIIGELGNIKWPSVVCGATDSAIVEEDELVGRREPVDKRGIPVCTCRAETI